MTFRHSLPKLDKRYFQRYQESTTDGAHDKQETDDEALLPLEEGILTNNLGVPLMIVVNKVTLLMLMFLCLPATIVFTIG